MKYEDKELFASELICPEMGSRPSQMQYAYKDLLRG
jgi:hypothetical protein